MSDLDPEILKAALAWHRHEVDRITALLAPAKTANPAPEPTIVAPVKGKRNLTPAARKRIGDAQKKRWVASKAAKVAAAEPAVEKPKRVLSAKGRRNIVAALKKRHEAAQAQKKPKGRAMAAGG